MYVSTLSIPILTLVGKNPINTGVCTSLQRKHLYLQCLIGVFILSEAKHLNRPDGVLRFAQSAVNWIFGKQRWLYPVFA
jgi:hypothetical protein